MDIKQCPDCGGEISETLRGVLAGSDPNTYKCSACGKAGNVADL